MPLRLLPVLGVFFLAACTTTAPPSSPEPRPVPPTVSPSAPSAQPDSVRVPSPEPSPSQTEPAPTETTPTAEEAASDSAAVDPLYAETEDALRLAFTDGLFGLYRTEVDPADARRLDHTEIELWLTDLELVSPRAVAFAREMLGPVLDEPYVVGLLLEDAAQAECASVRDVLYIPLPERFQGPDRAFNGYIVQDACSLSSGDLAPFCFGGYGTSPSGAACSCTCTTGEAPAQPCVSC